MHSVNDSTESLVQLGEQWSSWELLLKKAYAVATSSPDPSTQNGAGLVRLSPSRPGGGWADPRTWMVNDLPAGVRSSAERWDRPLKYAVVEHAERNAVYTAARLGISTAGMAMVCPWAPCTDCARSVIQSGVTVLVNHAGANLRTPASWLESLATAKEMLSEAGVTVLEVDAHLSAPEVRHTGELWKP